MDVAPFTAPVYPAPRASGAEAVPGHPTPQPPAAVPARPFVLPGFPPARRRAAPSPTARRAPLPPPPPHQAPGPEAQRVLTRMAAAQAPWQATTEEARINAAAVRLVTTGRPLDAGAPPPDRARATPRVSPAGARAGVARYRGTERISSHSDPAELGPSFDLQA